LASDEVGSWHFSDIEAARFNVRFRTLFGHQRIANLCRRMTLSRHQLGDIEIDATYIASALADTEQAA
jgi:hypothetical protein